MGKELMPIDGRNIQVTYADNIDATIKDEVIQAYAQLGKDGVSVFSIAVELYERTKHKIIFLDQYGSNFREVIPTLARTTAHQDARKTIRSMNLDEDLEDEAIEELNEIRRKRRERDRTKE